MRRFLIVAVLAAVAIYAALPPSPAPLPPAGVRRPPPVRGVAHVHTRRSDGSGTPERIARAAAAAGLRFVILTDHGDGTRTPDAPAYYGGVLVVDAVEISTESGHVVALGLPPSPYPLGGEARDVLEDVRRMGGFAVAAHPTSAKADLRWSDWAVPFDAIEYLNGDSEWRDENALALLRSALTYPFRPAETIAALYDGSAEPFRRWDDLNRTRRVVGLVGADAHGRLGLRGDPYAGNLVVPLPGYAPVFRSASIAVPDLQLGSDAAADAAAILDALRAGRVFSSIDALAERPWFEFVATSGRFRAGSGEVLPLDGPLRIDLAAQAPPGARILLFRDGGRVLDVPSASARFDADPPIAAAYRAEVVLPAAPGSPPVSWIVSNPIYVGRHFVPVSAPAAVPAQAVERAAIYMDGPAQGWSVEHSAQSRAALDVAKAPAGTQLLFRYAIAGPATSHPFAALVVPAGSIAGHARVTFKALSDRPMRLSVQLRAENGTPDGERWHRSVFVDTAPREVSVRFDDMRPRGATQTPKPRLDAVRSLLFVVDTVNTAPGSAGQVSIDEVRYEQ